MFDNGFSELMVTTIKQRKWLRHANKSDLFHQIKKYSPEVNSKFSKDDLVLKAEELLSPETLSDFSNCFTLSMSEVAELIGVTPNMIKKITKENNIAVDTAWSEMVID
jgi:hypothetical protein